MTYLFKDIVLILNKNWQAIGVKTPADTFGMLMTGGATALDIEISDNNIQNLVPMRWSDWVELPVKDNDLFVITVKGKIKIPKVIVLCKYDKVPKRRPRLSSKEIWKRDKGICAYSGVKLKSNEGNIDHIIPKSRGGKTSWQNCVLASKEINSKKGNRTPEEAGLTLLVNPYEPAELPSTNYVQNKHNIKEWNFFINN
jgi:5-methylcytosine-specific restriction endonuclease McrA